MITTHHAYPALKEQAGKAQKPVHVALGETLETLCEDTGMQTLTELTKDTHFTQTSIVSRTLRSPFDSKFLRPYTEFEFSAQNASLPSSRVGCASSNCTQIGTYTHPTLDNRSPLADSRMRGSFVALALDRSMDDLALKFNVTLEAIALQTRHIVETLNAKGHSVQEICISGRQAKNAPLVQLLADACGIPVTLPGLDGGSSVVLGAAMLGRFAADVIIELSSASGAFKSTGPEDHGLYADQTKQERAPILPTPSDVNQQSKGLGASLGNTSPIASNIFLYSTHQTPPTTLCLPLSRSSLPYAPCPSHCSSTSTISSTSYFNTLATCIQPPIISPSITNTFNMISTLVSMDITLFMTFSSPAHFQSYLFHLNGINPLVSPHALPSSVHDPPFPIYHVPPIFISPPARPYIARAAHKALDLYTITQGFHSHSPFVPPPPHHTWQRGLPFVW